MKAVDLVKKTVSELKDELLASLRELFNLRMQKGAGQLPKPNLLSAVKKDIARIKTILKQKGCSV